jgi:molybdopterin-guanine dinucleotide biosynthesis protein A
MGAPKAEITWRGERLADRAARVLTAVCDPVIEVGPGYTALPATVEEPPGGGPLAALVAGHHELVRRGAPDGPIVVLAVDLPFVGPELVRLLADWPGDGTVVPTADGHLQVLCARYGTGVVGAAAGLLAEGRRSLVGLIDRVPAEMVGETRWRAVAGANAHSFADVDTPDDVARWLADVDG